MADREMSDADLDRLSELLLDKLLRRLAKAAAAPVTIPPPSNANAGEYAPRPEDFQALAERRARRGKE